MKKGLRGYLVRSSLFLLIAFVIVPLLMNELTINKPASAGIPILIPLCVCVGMFVVFGLLQQEFNEGKARPIEMFICGALTAVYYFLLSVITYNAAFIALSFPQIYYFVQYLLYTLALLFLFFTVFSIKFTLRSGRTLLVSLCIMVPFTVISLMLVKSWEFFLALMFKLFLSLFAWVGIPATLVTHGQDVLLTLGKISAQFTLYDVGVFQLIAFGAFVLLLALGDRKCNVRTVIIGILGLIGAWIVNVIQIFVFLALARDDPALATLLLHPNTGWIVFAFYALLWYRFIYQTGPKKQPIASRKRKR